jgi:uncharacterized membrane protein YraQ (UPF0718 family)
LVDLASVILLASIFNWSVALAYVAIGLVLAVLGGSLIGKLGLKIRSRPLSIKAQ